MSLTPERVEQVGREMRRNTAYVTVLTRTQFDELMCRPQADYQMLPQEHAGAPQSALPTWSEFRDSAYDNVIHPYLSHPAALPLGMGAKDLYFDVWRRGRQMHGIFRTEFYEKSYNGKTYVILKGNQAQRSALRGTRYRADNATVMDFGIGGKAMAKKFVGGLKVAIGVGVVMEVIEWIFNDEYTAADLLGGIGTEIVKAGIGTAIAASLATLVGTLSALAFAPLATFVVVGALAGWGLNELDNHFEIKKKVQAATAASLDWLDEHTGQVGDWVESQYQDLRSYVNDSVENYRQSLDDQIIRADDNFETIMERTSESPYLTNPYEVRAAALQSSGLRFVRWMLGN